MPKEQEYPKRESFRVSDEMSKAISHEVIEDGGTRGETLRALISEALWERRWDREPAAKDKKGG